MHHSPRLTPDQTAKIADRLSRLFPESDWTPEQFDLFRTRIGGFDFAKTIGALDEYRAKSRARTPVLKDIADELNRVHFPADQTRQATELARMQECERKYRQDKARESEVSRTLHIPELLDLGEARVLAERDELLSRMGNSVNFSQRGVAGVPTWAELIDPKDERARILCWRYWIIVDSCERFAPELANV